MRRLGRGSGHAPVSVPGRVPRRLLALMLCVLVAASVGCAHPAESNRAAGQGLGASPVTVSPIPTTVPADSSALAGGGLPAVDSVDLPAGQSAGAASVAVDDVPTVEELLQHGLHSASASPAHLAIRGTPTATTVRCAWRGIARTAEQRADAIRFWLGLEATDVIPNVVMVEALFSVVLDTLDPDFRETAKANFRAIARGGESREYLFLTCFADYAVTNFLLGSGTTPATVTVAYDRMDEAASYELYVREHEAGTYGTDALQTRGAYEAGLQTQVVAAEAALSAEIGGAGGGGVPGADGGA